MEAVCSALLADKTATITGIASKLKLRAATIHDWVRRGDEGEEPYATFAELYHAARDRQSQRMLDDGDAYADDRNAAGVAWVKWKLEVLHRSRFGREQRIEHTGKDGGAIETTDRREVIAMLQAMEEGDRGE
jgi:hypothetical protein